MTGEPVTTMLSGSGGVPMAVLRAEATTLAERLAKAGPRTHPMQRDLARMPVFAPQRGIQLALKLDADRGSILYQQSLSIDWIEPLTVRDEAMLAAITDRWVRDGCPENRMVEITSYADGARMLAYGTQYEGRARERVWAALKRMKGVRITSDVQLADGRQRRLWGLIADAEYIERGRRGCIVVTLDRRYTALILAGSVRLANADTRAQLINSDEIAGRLWSFLESETIPHRGRPQSEAAWYPIFDAEPGALAVETWVPALGSLLLLYDPDKTSPAHRRHVVERIREACRVISRIDPRYVLRVERSRRKGMWNLTVCKAKQSGLSGTPIRLGRDANPVGEGRFEHAIPGMLTERTNRVVNPHSLSEKHARPDVAFLEGKWGHPLNAEQTKKLATIALDNGWSFDELTDNLKAKPPTVVDFIEWVENPQRFRQRQVAGEPEPPRLVLPHPPKTRRRVARPIADEAAA